MEKRELQPIKLNLEFLAAKWNEIKDEFKLEKIEEQQWEQISERDLSAFSTDEVIDLMPTLDPEPQSENIIFINSISMDHSGKVWYFNQPNSKILFRFSREKNTGE